MIFFPCKHLVVDIDCYNTLLKNKKEEIESQNYRKKKDFENNCLMCRIPIQYVFHLKSN